MRDVSRYVLSIDGGTESIRVGIVDESGRIVATASTAYPTHFPRDGWAEQDPHSWWDALKESVRKCIAKSTVRPSEICAICLDATTCTLVTLGTDGEVHDSALLWMDVRASEQAKRIGATGHAAMQYCPAGCSAEWMLSKALWIRECDPERYAKTALFLDYVDWLTYVLSGVQCVSLNTASQRWFYNTRGWKFPLELYRELGAEDLIEKIPRSVVPTGAYVGELRRVAAGDLGLKTGTPIFQGGGDAFVASLGLGITASGPMAMIAGSSNVFVTEAEREIHIDGLFGGFPDSLIRGLWLMEAGQVSAGSILSWYRKNFLRDLPDRDAYSIIDREASCVDEGSGGIIVLENFQGNRSPYANSSARGAIWGLSLGTSREELFRALIEGIAYGTEQILRVFEEHDIAVPELVVCGGATRSELYLQIVSNVTGVPIRLTQEPDAALVGCAVIAATGLGWYGDISDAAGQMVRLGRSIEPDGKAHERYLPLVAQHEKTYTQLKELMHERQALLEEAIRRKNEVDTGVE